MCFSAPKAPKPQAPPTPPPKPEPLANEALDKKRRNKNSVSDARQSLRIPIGGGNQSGGLGIPRG